MSDLEITNLGLVGMFTIKYPPGDGMAGDATHLHVRVRLDVGGTDEFLFINIPIEDVRAALVAGLPSQ